MQFYEAFGLPPKLAIDLDDLKKRFYDRTRQWHPDRFSRASEDEQRKALDMTALLNKAYRTLRDPVARAQYFFKEQGIHLAKEAPQDVLEEFFDLNAELEELRRGDESLRAQIATARERIIEMRTKTDTALAGLFEVWDKNEEARPSITEPMGDLLNIRRYIANFLRDADKELHVQLPN